MEKVFIRESVFTPDRITIRCDSRLMFSNTDDFEHIIQYQGDLDLPLIRVLPQQSFFLMLSKPGTFLFSSGISPAMQLCVEVSDSQDSVAGVSDIDIEKISVDNEDRVKEATIYSKNPLAATAATAVTAVATIPTGSTRYYAKSATTTTTVNSTITTTVSASSITSKNTTSAATTTPPNLPKVRYGRLGAYVDAVSLLAQLQREWKTNVSKQGPTGSSNSDSDEDEDEGEEEGLEDGDEDLPQGDTVAGSSRSLWERRKKSIFKREQASASGVDAMDLSKILASPTSVSVSTSVNINSSGAPWETDRGAPPKRSLLLSTSADNLLRRGAIPPEQGELHQGLGGPAGAVDLDNTSAPVAAAVFVSSSSSSFASSSSSNSSFASSSSDSFDSDDLAGVSSSGSGYERTPTRVHRPAAGGTTRASTSTDAVGADFSEQQYSPSPSARQHYREKQLQLRTRMKRRGEGAGGVGVGGYLSSPRSGGSLSLSPRSSLSRTQWPKTGAGGGARGNDLNFNPPSSSYSSPLTPYSRKKDRGQTVEIENIKIFPLGVSSPQQKRPTSTAASTPPEGLNMSSDINLAAVAEGGKAAGEGSPNLQRLQLQIDSATGGGYLSKSPLTNSAKRRSGSIGTTASRGAGGNGSNSSSNSKADVVTKGAAKTAKDNDRDKVVVTVITIEDYDFVTTTLSVCVGTKVRFSLADDVPHHAEHELVGKSRVRELRFTGPLLQRDERRSFDVQFDHIGEVLVSCKVYSDMQCRITVLPKGDYNNANSRDASAGSRSSPVKSNSLASSPAASPVQSSPTTKRSEEVFVRNGKKAPSSSSTSSSPQAAHEAVAMLPLSGLLNSGGGGGCGSNSLFEGSESSESGSRSLPAPVPGASSSLSGTSSSSTSSIRTGSLFSKRSPTKSKKSSSSTAAASASAANGIIVPAAHLNDHNHHSHNNNHAITPPWNGNAEIENRPNNGGYGDDLGRGGGGAAMLGMGSKFIIKAAKSIASSTEYGGGGGESISSACDSDDVFSMDESDRYRGQFYKKRLPQSSTAAAAVRVMVQGDSSSNNAPIIQRFANPSANTSIAANSQIGGGHNKSNQQQEQREHGLDHAAFEVSAVMVEDFRFYPSNITIKLGTLIDFVVSGYASTHKLVCEEEFDAIALSGGGMRYRHRFQKQGKFEVRDEIFSFMSLQVEVSENDAEEGGGGGGGGGYVESQKQKDNEKDGTGEIIITVAVNEPNDGDVKGAAAVTVQTSDDHIITTADAGATTTTATTTTATTTTTAATTTTTTTAATASSMSGDYRNPLLNYEFQYLDPLGSTEKALSPPPKLSAPMLSAPQMSTPNLVGSFQNLPRNLLPGSPLHSAPAILSPNHSLHSPNSPPIVTNHTSAVLHGSFAIPSGSTSTNSSANSSANSSTNSSVSTNSSINSSSAAANRLSSENENHVLRAVPVDPQASTDTSTSYNGTIIKKEEDRLAGATSKDDDIKVINLQPLLEKLRKEREEEKAVVRAKTKKLSTIRETHEENDDGGDSDRDDDQEEGDDGDDGQKGETATTRRNRKKRLKKKLTKKSKPKKKSSLNGGNGDNDDGDGDDNMFVDLEAGLVGSMACELLGQTDEYTYFRIDDLEAGKYFLHDEIHGEGNIAGQDRAQLTAGPNDSDYTAAAAGITTKTTEQDTSFINPSGTSLTSVSEVAEQVPLPVYMLVSESDSGNKSSKKKNKKKNKKDHRDQDQDQVQKDGEPSPATATATATSQSISVTVSIAEAEVTHDILTSAPASPNSTTTRPTTGTGAVSDGAEGSAAVSSSAAVSATASGSVSSSSSLEPPASLVQAEEQGDTIVAVSTVFTGDRHIRKTKTDHTITTTGPITRATTTTNNIDPAVTSASPQQLVQQQQQHDEEHTNGDSHNNKNPLPESVPPVVDRLPYTETTTAITITTATAAPASIAATTAADDVTLSPTEELLLQRWEMLMVSVSDTGKDVLPKGKHAKVLYVEADGTKREIDPEDVPFLLFGRENHHGILDVGTTTHNNRRNNGVGTENNDDHDGDNFIVSSRGKQKQQQRSSKSKGAQQADHPNSRERAKNLKPEQQRPPLLVEEKDRDHDSTFKKSSTGAGGGGADVRRSRSGSSSAGAITGSGGKQSKTRHKPVINPLQNQIPNKVTVTEIYSQPIMSGSGELCSTV